MKKLRYLKYNYFSLDEKVVQGRTAGNNVVIYAVPEVLTNAQAQTLIKAIEQDQKLSEVVRNPAVKSGTPEWNEFWTQLSAAPGVQDILAAHGAENLSRYRISRSTNTSDLEGMESYDVKAQADKRPVLPSFQAHWEDSGFGRTGAISKETPVKGKDAPR